MATAITGRKIGKEFCEALGLPSKRVTGITLNINPNDIVYVDVRLNVYQDEYNEIVSILKKYQITEIDNNLEG